MRRMILAALFAVSFVLPASSPAYAQDGANPAGEAKKPAEAGDSGAKKDEELVPITGEKVEAKLRSGVTLSGIVRSARTEILRGSRYVEVDSRDVPGVGIRIYYAMGLNGFVFIPYETIEEITFNGELTEQESREWAVRVAEAQRRADEERARQAEAAEAAKRAAEEEKAAEEAGEEGDGSEKSDADAEKARNLKIRELLKRFPPEEWKPGKLDELKKRAIIMDIFPNDEERAFMDNYDLWLEGYEMWEKSQPKK